MHIIYCHVNKINGKVYVGITSQTVQERWGKNGSGYQSSPHFWSAINKYGWDNFEHIVLETGLTKEIASQKEKEYIARYDSTNPKHGYNMRDGGLDSYTPCKETLEKAKIASQERKGTFGKKVLCITTGDVFQSAAEANRWSNTCKVGECCLGKRKNAGRHPETGELLQWCFALDTDVVTIHCLDKNIARVPKKNTLVMCENTGEIFPSYQEAAKWCGLKDTSNIIRCTNGERQSAGKHPETKEKLKWKKIKEN